ncbi:hypothetical protein MMC19_001565 [Ptychographa xylographoides]|nr:hypothetical protein [Ptychographa xylographoides]
MPPSIADDSSVDDNVSSIGESAWDILDNASVLTDDEDRELTRQYTPSSDGLEHVDHETGESVEGTNTSDESQGPGSAHNGFTSAETQHDSNSDSRASPSTGHEAEVEEDMENTEKALRPTLALQHHGQPFTFAEPKLAEVQSAADVEVSHILRFFDGKDFERICQSYDLSAPVSIVGTVRQKLSRRGLNVTEAYKVLYVGPTEVKESIIQKIGSALASSLDSTAVRSENGLSRFTVVPISSFGDGASPEVLLVDSLGLDLSVEECTSASLVAEDAESESISLRLNSQKSVQFTRNHTSNSLTVSKDYTLPNVAIFYLPQHETVSEKTTRVLARSVMSQHHIPIIMISSNTGWMKHNRAITLDLRTPHCCLEVQGSSGRTQRVLKRLPIDLATFLDVDSTQMGRNLACIASDSVNMRNKDARSHQHALIRSKISNILGGWYNPIGTTTQQQPVWLGFLAFLIGVTVYGLMTTSIGTSWMSQAPPAVNVFRQASSQSASGTPFASIPSQLSVPVVPSLATPTVTSSVSKEQSDAKSVSPVLVNSDLASFLLDPKRGSDVVAQNRSDKFKLHVIGDCHVVLRPPRWFTQLKKAPELHFRITRQKEPLQYDFSTLFDGVHALKLAREDAYGALNISVWTTKKPRINESFQVDFGTPWLKIAGWKKAAQAVTDQLREELHSAQNGLNLAYGQTSSGIQVVMKDVMRKADAAIKEVEKLGCLSLAQTSKTTEVMLAHSKELTRSLGKHLHQHGGKVRTRIAVQQKTMREEIFEYTRKMSLLFAEQGHVVAEAATGLNVATLAQEVQDYRTHHFKETQKQALKMWWKLRGGPPRRLRKVPRHERPERRHPRSMRGSNR